MPALTPAQRRTLTLILNEEPVPPRLFTVRTRLAHLGLLDLVRAEDGPGLRYVPNLAARAALKD